MQGCCEGVAALLANELQGRRVALLSTKRGGGLRFSTDDFAAFVEWSFPSSFTVDCGVLRRR